MRLRDDQRILMAWQEALSADSRSTSARCDSPAGAITGSSSRPPRVAFCLAGAARAFASPLLLSALRANLISPIAGRDVAEHGSRMFLSLKLADSAKRNVAGVSFGQHRSQAEPLLDALTGRSAPWLPPLLGEAVLLNGSGAYLGEEHASAGGPAGSSNGGHGRRRNAANLPGRISIVSADETLWRRYRATSCPTGGAPPLSGKSAAGKGASKGGSKGSGKGGGKGGEASSGPASMPNFGGRTSDGAAADGSAPCCRKAGYLLEGNNGTRLLLSTLHPLSSRALLTRTAHAHCSRPSSSRPSSSHAPPHTLLLTRSSSRDLIIIYVLHQMLRHSPRCRVHALLPLACAAACLHALMQSDACLHALMHADAS